MIAIVRTCPSASLLGRRIVLSFFQFYSTGRVIVLRGLGWKPWFMWKHTVPKFHLSGFVIVMQRLYTINQTSTIYIERYFDMYSIYFQTAFILCIRAEPLPKMHRNRDHTGGHGLVNQLLCTHVIVHPRICDLQCLLKLDSYHTYT